jgi:hypothetical protein
MIAEENKLDTTERLSKAMVNLQNKINSLSPEIQEQLKYEVEEIWHALI